MKNAREIAGEIARADFDSAQWPDAAHEDWRRSDPQAIPFERLNAPAGDSEYAAYDQVDAQLAAHHFAGCAEYTRFSPAAISDEARALLARSLKHETDKIDSWRVLRMSEKTAGFITVKAGRHLHEPVRIVLRGDDAQKIYAPQLVVVAAHGSQLSISIQIEGEGFFLPALYCSVGDDASVHYSMLQNAGMDSIIISNAFFECGRGASVRSTSGQLGGMIAVDRVHGLALGKHSDVKLNGYYCAVGDQLLDLRAYQHHDADTAGSRAVYHGVAKDEAHTVFRGLINVGHSAINTDAYLSNKNLLLSEEARMDSIPCLNINTNEVKCSHGSTTGKLDKEHIFYLMSRGLSEDEAKHMLVEGFFEAVFDGAFEDENATALGIIRHRMSTI